MTGIHEAEVPVQHRARSNVTSSQHRRSRGIWIVNLPLTTSRWWLVADLLLRYAEIFSFC